MFVEQKLGRSWKFHSMNLVQDKINVNPVYSLPGERQSRFQCGRRNRKQ